MWNLKDSIFANVDSVGPIYYGKPGTSPIPNYYDVSFAADKLGDLEGFNDDDKKNCNNIDACSTDDTKSLYYKVYYPLHNYFAKKLPAIIIAHAGGYSDCSNYKYLSSICIEFAKRGFVVFCVEYRRGRIKDVNGFICVQQNAAIYRATQDILGATRSIIKKQRDSGILLAFQIDTTHIYPGGQSAGATAMNIAMYCPTQAMINSVFPTPAGQPTIEDVLGPLDADYYYGGPDVKIMQRVKGVFNMWGGEPIPKSYATNQSDFFYSTDPNRNKPMIAFMGYHDPVFWYPAIKQKIYFSPPPNTSNEPNFNTDTFCLVDTPYSLDADAASYDLIMGSAINFYRILKDLGKNVEFYLDCQMGHGLDKDGAGFQSDFGTGLTTQAEVNKYMVQRICCYFQAEMNGLLGSLKGTDKFVECENYRVMCDTLANNDTCYQNKTCE